MDAEMRLALKNILVLTDFSEASEAAIPFAISIARNYEAKLYTLHVLTSFPSAYAVPEPTMATIEKSEEAAQAGMQRLAPRLLGDSVWSALERVLGDYAMDLVILGTHGRTGAIRFLLGSVAEEIFGRVSVPVLTIGPLVPKGEHGGGRLQRVLLATDFAPQAQTAASYAISMAEANEATLLLLHVMRDPVSRTKEKTPQDSAANVMHQLYELVPQDAKLSSRPQPTIRFGNAAERILDVAEEHDADLIVLGVRRTAGHLGATAPPARATAHKVVTHAECPVLTVRG
jgi:nucleotide-binding universal stress UspA family protein